MELTKHFDNLLTDTINLPKWRLEQLPERVETLYGKLRLSDSVGQLVTGKTPQGSWAHRTIIKPLPGLEYDADVLIHMKENESWDTTKAKYLDVIDRALESAGYAHRQAKTRCVRVSYANECHVDLVPYVLTSDGYHIVNAETGEWEDTNPEGFTAWMRERDDITNGNFRKVVRIMKFLRDHRASFTDVPSIILTTMMGNRISHDAEYGDPRAYQNVPKTLVTVVDAPAALCQMPCACDKVSAGAGEGLGSGSAGSAVSPPPPPQPASSATPSKAPPPRRAARYVSREKTGLSKVCMTDINKWLKPAQTL